VTDTGLLDIGEVSQRTGLAPSALRFYERRGLIAPAGRNGIRRSYEPGVLARLGLIACARTAGFTLAEIGRFLTATPKDEQVRRRMGEKARELDAELARLGRLRDSLAHAATCSHVPLVECPEFKATWEERDAPSSPTA
jgi:DNA-binding transcriptional MerR regulator